MSAQDIIRAWRNEEYLLSLSEGQRAALPENPVGRVELNDADLGSVERCTHDCTDCYSCWTGSICCC